MHLIVVCCFLLLVEVGRTRKLSFASKVLLCGGNLMMCPQRHEITYKIYIYIILILYIHIPVSATNAGISPSNLYFSSHVFINLPPAYSLSISMPPSSPNVLVFTEPMLYHNNRFLSSSPGPLSSCSRSIPLSLITSLGSRFPPLPCLPLSRQCPLS